jgi:hypothetical protein
VARESFASASPQPGRASPGAGERAGNASGRLNAHPAVLHYSNVRTQNRLLSMIRQQQQQILTLQTHNTHSSSSAVAIDDSTPTSERSMSYNQGAPAAQPNTSSTGSAVPRSRSPYVSHSLSRHSSYRSSRDASPSLRPISGYGGLHIDAPELLLGPSASRDESAFYQAETQTLTRENQMLKMRIRELGRLSCI